MQTVIVALVFVEWAGIDKICLPETHFLPPPNQLITKCTQSYVTALYFCCSYNSTTHCPHLLSTTITTTMPGQVLCVYCRRTNT